MPSLALADVLGNFLVVTAFKYTTITHVSRTHTPINTPNLTPTSRIKSTSFQVQLLDCFAVPCVIVLSWVALRHRYNAWQHAGAVACVAGQHVITVPSSLIPSLSSSFCYFVTHVFPNLDKAPNPILFYPLIPSQALLFSWCVQSLTTLHTLPTLSWAMRWC